MLPRSTIRNRSRTRSWLVLPLATALALVLSGTLLTRAGPRRQPGDPGQLPRPRLRPVRGAQPERHEHVDQEVAVPGRRASTSPAHPAPASAQTQPDRDLGAQPARRRLAPDADHPRAAGLVLDALPALRQEHRPDHQPELDQRVRRGPGAGQAEAQTRGPRRHATSASCPGSTLFYDLEAFDTRRSTACTQSANWFLHAWTTHAAQPRLRLRLLLQRRLRHQDDRRPAGAAPATPITMPDQIWIADWNGKANTSSSYIRSDGWQPLQPGEAVPGRAHRDLGRRTINIDRNYLNLRTPRLPGGTPHRPRRQRPALHGHLDRPTRGARRQSINRPSYRKTDASTRTGLIVAAAVPAQAAARSTVRGHRHAGTRRPSAALHGLPDAGSATRCAAYVTRGDWVSLLAARQQPAPSAGPASRGADVVRVQRALNAAGSPALPITGVYDTAHAPTPWAPTSAASGSRVTEGRRVTRPGRPCVQGRR